MVEPVSKYNKQTITKQNGGRKNMVGSGRTSAPGISLGWPSHSGLVRWWSNAACMPKMTVELTLTNRYPVSPPLCRWSSWLSLSLLALGRCSSSCFGWSVSRGVVSATLGRSSMTSLVGSSFGVVQKNPCSSLVTARSSCSCVGLLYTVGELGSNRLLQ